MSNALKGALSFLRPRSVEVPIVGPDGEPRLVTFWPVTVRRLLSLRDIGTTLAKALTTLFQNGNGLEDFKRITRTFDGGSETQFEPPATTTLEFRAKQKAAAIEAAMSCLLAEENQKIVAALIKDSLRDEENDFLEVDADTYRQLLMGMLKANAKILGPLEDRFLGIVKSAKSRLDPQEPTEDQPSPQPRRGDGSTSTSDRSESSEEASRNNSLNDGS